MRIRKLKPLIAILLSVTALGALAVSAHLALIEIGQDVVTLRTRAKDGSWKETRLWTVDDGDISWLNSAGERWVSRFADEPAGVDDAAGAVLDLRKQAKPDSTSGAPEVE